MREKRGTLMNLCIGTFLVCRWMVATVQQQRMLASSGRFHGLVDGGCLQDWAGRRSPGVADTVRRWPSR